jgi:hypothetical protein
VDGVGGMNAISIHRQSFSRKEPAMMSLPEFIYLAMGAIVARVLLEKTDTRGYKSLQWSQFIFDILRIVVLWPLVLFLDTFVGWLKAEEET